MSILIILFDMVDLILIVILICITLKYLIIFLIIRFQFLLNIGELFVKNIKLNALEHSLLKISKLIKIFIYHNNLLLC